MTAKPKFLSLIVLLGVLTLPALAAGRQAPGPGGPPGGPGGGGAVFTDAPATRNENGLRSASRGVEKPS